MNEFVKLSQLHTVQGVLFESVEVRTTSFEETFAKMATHNQQDRNQSLDSRDESWSLGNSTVLEPRDEDQQLNNESWFAATLALLATDFAWGRLWRSMLGIFFVSILLLG